MASHPELDPARLAVIHDCMEAYDVGDPDSDWPNKNVSRRALAYHDGTIALVDELPAHTVDEAELALCQSLSAEVAALMAGVSVGMGSEADTAFEAFFVAAPAGAGRPLALDETFVRRCFGGALFPPAGVTVEPLAEGTAWWAEVAEDGAGEGPSYFKPWRTMVEWFGRQPAFGATAFVRVGNFHALSALPEADYPPGTVMPGCNLPRLALGLTHRGSLAGLFGYAVMT